MSDVVINIHGSSAPQISTSTKTTLAAEEVAHECGCPHKHTPDDKTVRPCASEATASELTPGPSVPDEKITDQLRRLKLKARNAGDFNSAMLSAGYYAKKRSETMYVYPGNSFMHEVWRVTAKRGEALNPINNTGKTMFTVSPDLAVSRHEVRRSGGAAEDVAPVIYEERATEMPGPLVSAAGSAVGGVVAAALAAEDCGDCVPWVKIAVDAKAKAACQKFAEKFGPVNNAEKVYKLLHKEFHKRDQESIVVVPLDIRGNLRSPPIEVAYGQRSRVSVAVSDIMRAAHVSGAELILISHAHPSGKANPSKADRDLTKAVDEACKKSGEITFGDHVVVGQDSFFSVRENKLYHVK